MTYEVQLAGIQWPWCIIEVHYSTFFLKIRSEPSKHLFFAPAARSANESESTLEGSTTTEVAVLSNRKSGSSKDCGVAAAIHEHKLRVRLRRVRHQYALKARFGALDDNASSLGNRGLLAHTVT
jgi:hypothetical protein